MNNKHIPMISSGVAGPLGALHLPRLWLKVSLEATDQLADGYPGIGGGYDTMTCTALGLDPEAVKAFISGNKPTYPAFEAWVRQNGTKLTLADIERHNLAIRGYCHDNETRKAILSACSLPDDGSVLPGAIDLNNLEDWSDFHKTVILTEEPTGGA